MQNHMPGGARANHAARSTKIAAAGKMPTSSRIILRRELR
jgi:hypothetical protein